jgi:hypothetical protein
MNKSCEAVIARFVWGVQTCGELATKTFEYDGIEYATCDKHDPEKQE